MKNNIRFLLSGLTMMLSLSLVDCGGSSGSSQPAAVALGQACGTAGSNYIQSPWGCLPSCSTSGLSGGYSGAYSGGYSSGYGNAVYYGGTCRSFAGTSGVGSVQPQCVGSCGNQPGTVQIPPNQWYPNGACMPQLNCTQYGACYGSDGQYCYPGLY
jgi:hypothetical protein